jgi:hypothetical protein
MDLWNLIKMMMMMMMMMMINSKGELLCPVVRCLYFFYNEVFTILIRLIYLQGT